jgi:predicted transcriptional regulator
MSKKETDRHLDPPMVVYPMRIEVESLQQIRKLARKLDRTNQYMLREAVTYYLARKGKA